MEQVFFNVPLSRLEPIFKRWVKEAQSEMSLTKVEVEKPEQFLTVEQAADFLSLTVPTIYTKVNRRELPYIKRGKRLYFAQTELIEYLHGGKVKTAKEINQEAENYLKKKGLNYGK